MDDPTPNPLAKHPAFLTVQLGWHITTQFIAALAPLGIHPRHMGMLSFLLGRDGASQQQLCDALGIHRNVMVGMVDELEKAGFVERRRHPADRRAHAVHLLAAGREMQRKAEETLSRMEDGIFGSLTAAERAAYLATLQQLAADAGLSPGIHPALRDSLPGS
ncbi:MAG: winged helix-turn-helix transcriptional regulator [Mycobacteriaceae bacterium]|nr:winged helix-turn-helix transcriptional regulator [Mycobacteriaceae bacterium]